MYDLGSRLIELGREGFECSQILMILSLELEGEENSELVRAMGGLNSGMGRSGNACGALTGGACVLGRLVCKGEAEEMPHSRANEIISNYVNWFTGNYGDGSCNTIIGGDFSQVMLKCSPVIESCFEKIVEIIEEYSLID